MTLRLTILLITGFALASCSVDPRWGPPRTGLLDPLKWQYEDLDSGSTANVQLAVALNSSNP